MTESLLRIRSSSSSADCWYGRNLRAIRHLACQASCVADVFVSDEDVDVLAHLALLVDYAVAQAGMKCPEECEGVSDGSDRECDLDRGTAGGEFAQGSGNMNDNRQCLIPHLFEDREDRRDF